MSGTKTQTLPNSRIPDTSGSMVPMIAQWCNRFLGGDKSGYIPRESHDAIREHFPAADFEYVADAGHWVHADNPKGFMDKLLPFLEGRL